MLDMIIKNGKIVDGTGNPWFYGDVGIKDGTITSVGYVDQEAATMIDAKKHVVAPGFIDGHCHSDLMILNHPLSEIKLQQGVTTELVGNCGLAPAPSFRHFAAELRSYVLPIIGESRVDWPWAKVADYVRAVVAARPAENIATYAAHGSLRIAVMGFAKRPATPREIKQMKQLLHESMQAGAIGLSIGLLYAPGSYAMKEEIAELCTVLSHYDGLLATHIRGEGNNLIPSIKEVLWIAEKSGVALQISHLKAAGKANWGKVMEAMALIADARAKGMDVTCDVYPYSAGSTMLSTILPPWVLEGGMKQTLERFKNASLRKQIKNELSVEQKDWDNLICSTGWQSVYISSVQSANNHHLEGKHMDEVSEIRGEDPVDCMMDLLIEEEGNVSIIYFHMSDDDVKQVIAWDKSIIASDSLHCETGKPHPRLYGSFPRVLAKYVREDKVLTLEDAIRKMTSFPAQRFKMGSRGMLASGYAADLVIFDPDTIQDTTTYEDPVNYPNGISKVMVNGEITINNGTHTQARAGSFITLR